MIAERHVGTFDTQSINGTHQPWEIYAKVDEQLRVYVIVLKFGVCAERDIDDKAWSATQRNIILSIVEDWKRAQGSSALSPEEQARVTWGISDPRPILFE